MEEKRNNYTTINISVRDKVANMLNNYSSDILIPKEVIVEFALIEYIINRSNNERRKILW